MRLPSIAACALAFLFAAPALAENAATGAAPCAPRDQIVTQLEKKYGETRRGAGLQNRGSVTEVFASSETGTWTILVTRPDGVSCAVAAGEAWLEDVASLETPPV
ncbi:hypothetical protein [Rubrimonas cliftonensis]|uniref:Peptidase propeptide and YPEB domain-containing protein n=1 Tax=Rubrimonas cliftonensis TaxID=89524 RepID=A0A1H3VTF7_9RHOB|nr:hypothetical protein [Rubrimonas cliftonensis]SDZ78049.1 hypothetical protein SAMN05444370_101313 [Rubrimonas cliftonensis]